SGSGIQTVHKIVAYGGVGVVSNIQNAGVMIQAGNGIFYENVTVENHAGAFALLIGSYGFPERVRNAGISRCTVRHAGDDPNQGDASNIAIAAINYYIDKCTVDADSSNNVAWPIGLAQGTAFELHGSNWTASNLKAVDTQRFMNSACDSFR